MLLSDLWLEDLFRVYLNSPEALDHGPLGSRPVPYNPAAFGNPTERMVGETIQDKLRAKRQQEDIAVFGWYVRFVSERRVVRDETRRNALWNWIRYPRVYVTNSNEFETGKHGLVMSFQAYEHRIWTVQGPEARLVEGAGDRIGVWGTYSGPVEAFITAIQAITNLAAESILNVGAVVNMEIDFAVHPSALGSMSRSQYRFTREASVDAIRAWNTRTPRQRSGLVFRAGALSVALRDEYVRLHGVRGISVPD